MQNKFPACVIEPFVSCFSPAYCLVAFRELQRISKPHHDHFELTETGKIQTQLTYIPTYMSPNVLALRHILVHQLPSETMATRARGLIHLPLSTGLSST